MPELTEEQEDALDKVLDKIGKECSDEIIAVAKKLHPDAEFILPLYRSCLVILKRDNPNHVLTIIAYHDPHWLGTQCNEETLPRFKQVYMISGQRDRVDIYKQYEMDGYPASEIANVTFDQGEMMTMQEAIDRKSSDKFWEEITDNVQIAKKAQAKYEQEHQGAE